MNEPYTLDSLKRRWDNAELILHHARSALTNAEALVRARDQEVVKARQDADEEFDALLEKQAPGDPDIVEPDLTKIEASQESHLKALNALHSAQSEVIESKNAVIDARSEYEVAIAVKSTTAEISRLDAEHSERIRGIESSAAAVPNLVLAVVITVGLAIAGGGFYLLVRKPAPREPVPTSYALGTDLSSAQVVCEYAIKKVSRDPEMTKVPFVRGTTGVDAFNFTWSRNSSLVRMRNGLGNEVGVEVSCAVRKTDGKIISLMVDGRTIPMGL